MLFNFLANLCYFSLLINYQVAHIEFKDTLKFHHYKVFLSLPNLLLNWKNLVILI